MDDQAASPSTQDEDKQIKTVFVFPHIGFYRHVDGVVRELLARGHSVKCLFGIQAKGKSVHTNRAVNACQDDFPGFEIGWLQMRQGGFKRLLFAAREMINYSLYLRPGHPSPQIRNRWKSNLPGWMWSFVSSRIGEKILATPAVFAIMQMIERIVQPDGAIALQLLNEEADLVVDVTNLVFNAQDVEYQKAAMALHIPLVISIASWDNLTTKGTFHFFPDLIFVWNQNLVAEASGIHRVPEDRILITGAPTFDYLFTPLPALTREGFCDQAGLDPTQDFVVYLCSSVQVAGDETNFVREFAENMRGCPETANTPIMVRPYPMNAGIWQDFKEPNVLVWPPDGETPDIQSTQRNYFNSLFYCKAVVGVNTTAMIEAAIVDKPCVTILTERYRATQMERGHFQYLLNADFLEIAEGFEPSAKIIAGILRGEDAKAENRRKFVHEFIRPWGMETPVAAVFASAIELAAKRKSARVIENEIQSKFSKDIADTHRSPDDNRNLTAPVIG